MQLFIYFLHPVALPDVATGDDARSNTWNCWSVPGVEKKAADWTAYCGVFASIVLFTATAIHSLDYEANWPDELASWLTCSYAGIHAYKLTEHGESEAFGALE